MKQFIFPDLKFNKKNPALPGVYRMVFDETYFYIGSSRSLMQRFWSWKFRLETGEKKNFIVTEKFEQCEVVRFEILEVVPKGVDTKIREDFFIKQNWGNPLFLNRCDNAYVNNSKKTPEQIEVMKLIAEKNKQKVAQFDKGGNLIKIHDSVIEAAMQFGKKGLSRCFKKAGLTAHGFIFKKVDKDGNVIEPPVIPRVKPYGKPKGCKLSEESKKRFNDKRLARISSPNYTPPVLPLHTKKVNQYDLNGAFVMTHDSVRAAARYFNLKDHRELQKTLNGRAGKTYKKHIWKYA